MKQMQLKEALRLKGYKVKDLYERMAKRYVVSYSTIARYCRCDNFLEFNRVIWSWMREILKEMEVEWDGKP